MLVSELRELLKKYKEEDLRLIIVEMYKDIPKKLRENKGIDDLLKDPDKYLSTGKKDNKPDNQIDIKELNNEISLFIDYAYKQYYYAPNSFVHKKERPKWRFKVKAYFKSLQCVPNEGEDGRIATDLIEKLYNMLCYACCYYIFNTEDPFRSVGIMQTAMLDIVIKRKLGCGINKESVNSVIKLVINRGSSREILHSDLMKVLISNLKTPDSKEIAIDQCVALKSELDKKKQSSKYGNSDYERKEKIEYLVEMVFRLNISLCEYERAIKYYNENNVKNDPEVSLYVLLKMLFEYKVKEHWLAEYDKAVKKGVKPRESLQKTYKYIIENNEFPDYFNNQEFILFGNKIGN